MNSRPNIRPDTPAFQPVVVASDGVLNAVGAELLEVATKTDADAALSRHNVMDSKRWSEIYARFTESFASQEFKNATGAILPATLDETIGYIHEAFNARLLNQQARQRRLANLLRRAKNGDLRVPRQSSDEVKTLAELIAEIKNTPIGTYFDEHELDFWTNVLALELGVEEREIRQFFWQAEADDTGKYRCIYTRKKKKIAGQK